MLTLNPPASLCPCLLRQSNWVRFVKSAEQADASVKPITNPPRDSFAKPPRKCCRQKSETIISGIPHRMNKPANAYIMRSEYKANTLLLAAATALTKKIWQWQKAESEKIVGRMASHTHP